MHFPVGSLPVFILLVAVAAGCSSESQQELGHTSPCPGPESGQSVLSRETMLRRLAADRAPEFAAKLRLSEIADDSRWVLPGVSALDAPRRFTLKFPADAQAPVRRRIALDRGHFRFAKRVLADLRLRTDEWQSLGTKLLTIERDDEGPFIELEVDLSESAQQHTDAQLVVMVYSAARHLALRYASPVVAIPSQPSWLAFSFGVLEPAWSQGPVRFRLRACEGRRCQCLHEEVVDPAVDSQRYWQERRVSLAPLTGRNVSFHFESEPVAPLEDGYTLAQWETPHLLVESREAPGGRHNLLLISLDTLRADHLGAYGYRRETSPFMSGELAERSTLFENVVAPATTTVPSHMTLFTSLPPSVHGVVSNLRERGLPDGVPTLAGVLRRGGYATGSINENGAINRRMGFGKGFDYYVEHMSARMIRPEGHVGRIFSSGRRFIKRHRGQRWFLFLHTYEVHYPYTAPEAYADLFPEGDDPSHPDNVRLGKGRKLFYPVLYDREIRYLDSELEKLLRDLDTAGDLDDTLVVITADHGEAFLEHSFVGHGSDVHQETVHIPLFVLGPGIEGGRRIRVPVGLGDLMPTLLEWLEIPAPDELMGRSFASLLGAGAEADYGAGNTIVSEAWHHMGEAADGKQEIIPPTLAVRRGRHKLIRYKTDGEPRYEFYDLLSDPAEERDLFDLQLPVVRGLKAVADGYEQDSSVIARRLGVPPLERDAPTTQDIDPDRLEALRALGYVE